MAIPLTAKEFDQLLDPSDRVDFYVVLLQGAADSTPAPILLMGEAVASYTLAVTPEAAALGVRISTDPEYVDRLTGNVLKVYLEMVEDEWTSPLFDGRGVIVAIELTIITTSTPPRRKQRSFLVRIANQ